MIRETVRCLGSEERLGKICVLRHGVQLEGLKKITKPYEVCLRYEDSTLCSFASALSSHIPCHFSFVTAFSDSGSKAPRRSHSHFHCWSCERCGNSGVCCERGHSDRHVLNVFRLCFLRWSCVFVPSLHGRLTSHPALRCISEIILMRNLRNFMDVFCL